MEFTDAFMVKLLITIVLCALFLSILLRTYIWISDEIKIIRGKNGRYINTRNK